MRATTTLCVSFIVTLTCLLATSLIRTDSSVTSGRNYVSTAPIGVPQHLPLAGLVLASDPTVRPATTEFVSDTATVVLLGGVLCSGPQVEVLANAQSLVDGGSRVRAVFADPSRTLDENRYEALLLKRLSRTTFPFYISTDSTLDFRRQGFRPPLVVEIRNGVVHPVGG